MIKLTAPVFKSNKALWIGFEKQFLIVNAYKALIQKQSHNAYN